MFGWGSKNTTVAEQEKEVLRTGRELQQAIREIKEEQIIKAPIPLEINLKPGFSGPDGQSKIVYVDVVNWSDVTDADCDFCEIEHQDGTYTYIAKDTILYAHGPHDP